MGLNDSQREYLSGELETQRQQLQEQKNALEETLRELEAVYDDDSELDWETQEAERVRQVRAEIEETEAHLAELKQRKNALVAASDSFVADEYRVKIAALPERDRKALEDFHGNYQAMAYGYLLRRGYDRKEIDAMWETMQRDKNAEFSESAINGTC